MNSSPRDAERPSGAAQLIPPGLDAVLVLLRHGQTQFIVEKRFQGQMEAPLTDAGQTQAVLAGRRLTDVTAPPPLPIPPGPPYSIVHSPLGRARMTTELAAAEMWASGMDLPQLREDAGFSEIAQGGWEGLKDTEIVERFGDSLAAWRRWPEANHAPGGESLADVRARVERALARVLGDLAQGATPGTIDRHQVLGYESKQRDERRWSLIVGHGGVFRVVMCVLLDLPMSHFWNFDFGLAAITVVEIRAGRAVLRAMNLDGHLDGIGEQDEASKRGMSGAT